METEKRPPPPEELPLFYSFTFWKKNDKTKIKEIVRQWQDKTFGNIDGNPNRRIITLYAGENCHREPVVFIDEDCGVLRVVVVGRDPVLAKIHLQTVCHKSPFLQE